MMFIPHRAAFLRQQYGKSIRFHFPKPFLQSGSFVSALNYLRYLRHYSRQQCLKSTPCRRALTAAFLFRAISELPILNDRQPLIVANRQLQQLSGRFCNVDICLFLLRNLLYIDKRVVDAHFDRNQAILSRSNWRCSHVTFQKFHTLTFTGNASYYFMYYRNLQISVMPIQRGKETQCWLIYPLCH